jgi:hypothetical protein
MKAIAQSVFHFWGHYSSQIMIAFKRTELEAPENQAKFSEIFESLYFAPSCPVYNACGAKLETKGWQVSNVPECPYVAIIGWFSGDDLKRAIQQVKDLGASEIDSMKKSIDRSPACEFIV